MVVKLGRFGAFLSCTGYPDCKNSKDIPKAAGDSGEQSDDESEEACDICGKPMTLRRGRFGPFLGCTGYPDCKNIKRLPKDAPRDTGVPCPRCDGSLVERRGRRGPFYGCSNYPTCNFLVNRQPLPQPCPECDGLMVLGAREQANCTNCAWKGPLPAEEPAGVA